MSYGEAKEFIHCGCRPKTDDYMVNQVLDEIEFYLKVYDVKPKVYLSYERVALFSRTDPDFRVTFDGNIISRRDRLDLFCEDRGESLLDDGELVMETKFSGAIPAWFCDILSKTRCICPAFQSTVTSTPDIEEATSSTLRTDQLPRFRESARTSRFSNPRLFSEVLYKCKNYFFRQPQE